MDSAKKSLKLQKTVESRSDAVATDAASFPLPSHQTGRADFPHQMWSTTFDALCGLATYVALDS
jgi:hypothetical protein